MLNCLCLIVPKSDRRDIKMCSQAHVMILCLGALEAESWRYPTLPNVGWWTVDLLWDAHCPSVIELSDDPVLPHCKANATV